jgi:hypothetical protein
MEPALPLNGRVEISEDVALARAVEGADALDVVAGEGAARPAVEGVHDRARGGRVVEPQRVAGLVQRHRVEVGARRRQVARPRLVVVKVQISSDGGAARGRGVEAVGEDVPSIPHAVERPAVTVVAGLESHVDVGVCRDLLYDDPGHQAPAPVGTVERGGDVAVGEVRRAPAEVVAEREVAPLDAIRHSPGRVQRREHASWTASAPLRTRQRPGRRSASPWPLLSCGHVAQQLLRAQGQPCQIRRGRRRCAQDPAPRRSRRFLPCR